MRIVFMGTPEFAVTPLEILLSNGFNVVGVYTQPDREAGRGRALTAPPVKSAALKWGLPVFQPVSLKPAQEQAKLASLMPDVVIAAAYGQILRPGVLSTPPYGCLNIHPSLLPRYRGVSPVYAAVLNGDEFTGVSIMLLDAGVDTGPVLAQTSIRVGDGDTTGSLTEKLARIGGQLLADILPRWVNGSVTARPQEPAPVSYTRVVEKSAGEIDWSKTAVRVWRQVRACQPWPGAYTRLQGKQLKIIEATPIERETVNPGRVAALDGGFGIETGGGLLLIEQVQLEGKRPMSGADFMRGQRQLAGTILPS